MTDQTLRQRTISELVDMTFSLYRRHASAYIMVTAIAAVPGLIAQLLLQRASEVPGLASSLGGLFLLVISMITYALMTGVVTKVGSDVYLGGEADVAGAVRHVIPRIRPLIAVAIMKSIYFFLYALLLLFPVFIAFAKYFAPEAAVVLEGKNSSNAMERSASLSDGIRWHILGALVLGYGIYFLLGFGLGLLGVIGNNEIVALFVQTLVTVVAYPIVGLLSMLLYYDARIRKEGFDVEHLARVLGDAAAVPAVPAR